MRTRTQVHDTLAPADTLAIVFNFWFFFFDFNLLTFQNACSEREKYRDNNIIISSACAGVKKRMRPCGLRSSNRFVAHMPRVYCCTCLILLRAFYYIYIYIRQALLLLQLLPLYNDNNVIIVRLLLSLDAGLVRNYRLFCTR